MNVPGKYKKCTNSFLLEMHLVVSGKLTCLELVFVKYATNLLVICIKQFI